MPIASAVVYPTAIGQSDIPPAVAYWLTVDGSLTALLEKRAGQPLRVERTFEGYRLLTLAQKKRLGYQGSQLSRPMLAWVRDVDLYGNSDRPWVRAQSVFPLPSLKGEAKRLQYLQGTPIGYALFKRQKTLSNQRYIGCDTVESGAMRCNIMDGDTIKDDTIKGDTIKGDLIKDVTDKRDMANWWRQTCYEWQGRPLLITETFLESFVSTL